MIRLKDLKLQWGKGFSMSKKDGEDLITDIERTILGKKLDQKTRRNLEKLFDNGTSFIEYLLVLCKSPDFVATILENFHDAGSHEHFLEQVYRELLGRKIDDTGKQHFLQALYGGNSRTSIILAIVTSEEFLTKLSHRLGAEVTFNKSSPVSEKIDPRESEKNVLPDNPEIRGKFNRIWDEIYETNRDRYLKIHKNRYEELFVTLTALFPKKTVRLLEIGPSVYISFYKKLFDNIELITLDRPLSMNGASYEWCRQQGHVDAHYHVDLQTERLKPVVGDPPLGTFDIIICTEVLEHLLVNPVEFFSDLLSLLNEKGICYLSTPNFLSYSNLEAMKRGENPQHVFPGIGENNDGHHHFREYAMTELLTFIKNAGGKILQSNYSDSWNDDELKQTVLKESPELCSNLVVLFTKI